MKLDESYNPIDVESRWYPFWLEKGLFRATPSKKKPYTIVIPPPNVTGRLHMGHSLFVTLQDVLIRWKRMSGFEALWLPGTDHAGIATQVMVEKQLAKEGTDRHQLGRDAFLKRVWEWKEEHGGTIIEQMKRMGASADWSRERFTMEEDLTRSVTEAFVRLYEEGLIFRAERMVDWDPVAQTVLSNLEVDREEEQGRFWYLRYPLADKSGYIVVGTTRPETMLGDTAVAVHPDDERYQEMIGKEIELPIVGRRIPIIADTLLPDPEKGTGAVKVTPAHDPNDFACGQRHNLECIQVIGFDAKINDNAPEAYRGLDRYDARKKIVEEFKALGLFEREEDRPYAPGRSQRSGAIVEPLPMLQWFVQTEPLAKRAVEVVESGETQIIPSHWRKTYDHFLGNIEPWCISRQLWWGHRIPAWYCQSCDFVNVSREEMTSCQSCGSSEVVQEEDVLDTWFSSALWPFSTLGWPKESADLDYFYPTAVLETGFDILFFWVARMVMMGTHFIGKSPFEKVFLHAMVRDSKGQKMSKTKGNVIDPMHMIEGATREELDPELHQELIQQYPEGVEAHGADALRFTLGVYAAQGRDIKLEVQRMGGYRAFLNKLWNASKFALMNLNDYTPTSRWNTLSEETWGAASMADRWICARCVEVVDQVNEALDQFNFSDYAQTLYHFVWHEFCDWYIEMVKLTLYNDDPAAAGQRRATQEILLYVLDTILRLMHPLTPFITEDIWQSLPKREGQPESIVIAPFPARTVPGLDPSQYTGKIKESIETLERLNDPEAVQATIQIQDVISSIRNIRGETNVKPSVSIPLLYVAAPEDSVQLLQKGEAYVKKLAKLEAIQYVSTDELERMEGCASALVHHYQIRIPLKGMINVDEEISRLRKQIEKIDTNIAHVSKKLANERFVANAPQQVVDQERERLVAFTKEKETLEQSLEDLKNL